MDQSDLLRRLDEIERRLRRLEGTADIPETPHPPPPIPLSPSLSRPPTESAPSGSAPADRNHFEHLIGLKWAGWIGAIVLVVGAGLGIQFAYEHGWFAAIPPIARMAMLCAASAALLAAGEWVYRRVTPLAAAGFFGAGVATLFLTCYAGHAYYDLYGRGAAWMLMIAATAVGAAVAWRGNLVSIAVLSLVGGYLVPLLLPMESVPVAPFCAYLLALQLVALVLAAWGSATPDGSKWWTLRAAALTGTCIWAAVGLGLWTFGSSTPLVGFLLLWAGLFQMELLFSATREPDPSGRSIGISFSILVTAGLTAALLWHYADQPTAFRTVWLLGLGTACAGASLATNRRRVALQQLSFGFAMQAAGLVVVAVPVALSGLWIALGWGGLATVFAVVGSVLHLPSARIGAQTCWWLAVADVAFWTAGPASVGAMPHDSVIWLTVLASPVPAYAVMSFVLAAIGHAIARLIGPPLHMTLSPTAAAADGLWAVVALIALPPLGATGTLWLGGVLLLAWAATGGGIRALQHAVVLLCLAVGKWLTFDTLIRHFNGIDFASSGVLLNSTTVVGLLLLAGWLALLAGGRRYRELDRHRSIGWGVCVLILLWEGSIEIDLVFMHRASGWFVEPGRAEQVALSIFWASYALLAVMAGFVLRLAMLRYFGLCLFALTLMKVMSIDLSQVSTGYRVLSFLGLGLLLLGTSVLYGKLSPWLLGDATASDR